MGFFRGAATEGRRPLTEVDQLLLKAFLSRHELKTGNLTKLYARIYHGLNRICRS